jgi:PTH1 family peptidyl-tRNA hydrolase
VALVVGLRNPGSEYRGTRHNLGGEVVTEVATRGGVGLKRAPRRIRAEVGALGDDLLVLPTTFMNDTGRALAGLLGYFHQPAAEMLVVHDDIDLAFGRLRLQNGGGSGGHNGVRSLVQSVGGEFARLKLGVGRPQGDRDPADYVLTRFTKAERTEVDLMVEDAIEVVRMWLQDRARAAELAAHRRFA